MKNDKLIEKYLVVRDSLESFIDDINLHYTDIDSAIFNNLRISMNAMLANLNLLYFETRINKLHNEEPSERMLKIAESIFIDIPRTIKSSEIRLRPYKIKTIDN